MFGKIIVAHDHRDGGRDAHALGCLLAGPADADIVLVGVIPVGMMPADAEVVWRDEEHEFAGKIRDAADDSDGEARVFHSHSVAKGLTDLSEEIGADLIVVGSSRSADGSARWWRTRSPARSCTGRVVPWRWRPSGIPPTTTRS